MTAKPEVGEVVHYFDPKIVQRIGWTEGFGKRGKGPYAAIVSNDLGNGLSLLVLFPGVGGHQTENVAGPESDHGDKPYWDFRNASQKARAQKAFNEREAAKAEAEAAAAAAAE